MTLHMQSSALFITHLGITTLYLSNNIDKIGGRCNEGEIRTAI